MAVSPFIKMYWGRPTIKVEFEQRKVNGDIWLECLLTNQPTSWIFSHIFGVERDTADDIWAAFSIEEDRTHRIVVPLAPTQLVKAGCEPTTHISLPSSLLPMARFAIIFRRQNDKEVKLAQNGNFQVLPKGQYVVNAIILVSGRVQRASRRFIIQNDSEIDWLCS